MLPRRYECDVLPERDETASVHEPCSGGLASVPRGPASETASSSAPAAGANRNYQRLTASPLNPARQPCCRPRHGSVSSARRAGHTDDVLDHTTRASPRCSRRVHTVAPRLAGRHLPVRPGGAGHVRAAGSNARDQLGRSSAWRRQPPHLRRTPAAQPAINCTRHSTRSPAPRPAGRESILPRAPARTRRRPTHPRTRCLPTGCGAAHHLRGRRDRRWRGAYTV